MCWKANNAYPDIYFEPDYARLYENKENTAVEFKFDCKYGEVTNLFLKRKIKGCLEDERDYYDIITPYGYGGPIIHSVVDKKRLIDSYMKAFKDYTEENNIISEFVRFHPIVGNGVDFMEAYGSIFDRKTVGTNLTFDDVIATEFSKHKRKDIKKILNNPNVRYEIDEKPKKLDDFVSIYYSTMNRDGADSFYYFGEDYFRQILSSFPNNIITGKVFLKDQLIAMGIYFRYGKYLHAHLSGTVTEFLEYSPAYILKYALALYGHDKGYALIHYGGGSSRSPENGLYRFKKEFGKNTEFDFYIAKKIWNEKVYQDLCTRNNVDPNSEFFPAYRAGR